FLRPGAARGFERFLRPAQEFVRVIEKALRRAPVAQLHRRALAHIGEWLRALLAEVRFRLAVRLQIERLIRDQREHDPAAIDPGAAEHAFDTNVSEASELILQEKPEVLAGGHGCQDAVSGSRDAGLRLTDSPQPQALA